MIPPRSAKSAKTLSFTHNAAATLSRIMLIDHYPTATGGMESRVSWAEGNCTCHLQDYRPAGVYEQPAVAPLCHGSSAHISARKYVASVAEPAAVFAPCAAVYLPNTMIQQATALPAQLRANQFSNVQSSGLSSTLLQQQQQQQYATAPGASSQSIEAAVGQITSAANPLPKRRVTVTEKACDVDIDLKRTIPAKVSLSYNVEYESDDVPRPDEELVNVSIRNLKQLGTQIPDNFAQLVGSAIHAPSVPAN